MTFLRQTVSDLGYRAQKSVDGRLRISPQISLGDYKQHNDAAMGEFNTEQIGGGNFIYENSCVGGTELNVTSLNDAVIRQSYQWHNYFAGKPQKIELTASYFQPQTDVVKRMGYFSSTTTTPFDTSLDGMFFESSNGTIYCKVLRNGTEMFSLEQSAWENQSELVSFAPTNFNFYVIEFLYLGGAVVNFWVLTEYGLTKIATYQHVNVDVNTFVKSPNQPIRYEIRSTGGAGEFNHICSDVAVEGFSSVVGIESSHNNGPAYVSLPLAGTRYALIGIRQKADRRNVQLGITNGSFISGSNDDLLVELYYGGTTAGTETWTPSTFSNVETYNAADYVTEADRVHTGGRLIDSLYVVSSGNQTKGVQSSRRIGSYINGQREPAYVCVTPFSASASVSVSMNWNEFI